MPTLSYIEPLDDIVKKITSDRLKPRDVMCSLENYPYRFSEDIHNILKSIFSQRDLHASNMNFASSYGEKILSSLGVGKRGETIFGRHPLIIRNIRNSGSVKDNKPVYIITMTEQTGPPLPEDISSEWR